MHRPNFNFGAFGKSIAGYIWLRYVLNTQETRLKRKSFGVIIIGTNKYSPASALCVLHCAQEGFPIFLLGIKIVMMIVLDICYDEQGWLEAKKHFTVFISLYHKPRIFANVSWDLLFFRSGANYVSWRNAGCDQALN